MAHYTCLDYLIPHVSDCGETPAMAITHIVHSRLEASIPIIHNVKF
jgi:hypothetical protein